MPAFVVGFELPTGTVQALGERVPGELSSFVLLHEHQWGGYSCAQAWLLGVTLRFEPNRDMPRGLYPLEELRLGLMSLGELSAEAVASVPLHAEVSWLRDLSPTFGQDYDEADRKLLEKTVREAVPGMPGIAWAAEAFVRFEPGFPPALRDWRAFTVSADSPRELGDWDFEEATVADDLELTASRVRALEALGEAEGWGPVRAFLLWENSD